MNLKQIGLAVLLITIAISACKKNTSCPSVNLCPAPNPSYFAVSGNDTALLYIPNAFTPDSDGVNDYFEVFGSNIATINCVIYYNNTPVYQIDNLPMQWNGYMNGKQTIGLYTLKISGTSAWGSAFNLTGTLSLINGAFEGNTSQILQPITQNMYLNLINAQFPNQDHNAMFDAAIPSGEYVISDSIIVCH